MRIARGFHLYNKKLNEVRNIELDKDKTQTEGDSDFIGFQYIDKNTNFAIYPINLIKLNVVKDIYDIL